MLSRRRWAGFMGSSRGAPLVVGAAAVLIAGCHLIVNTFRSGRELSTFPHAVHMAQEGMTCGACHEPGAKGRPPSFPDRETCASCHDEDDEAALFDRFFAGDAGRWVHAGRQDGEILFDHSVHAAAGEAACRKCHEDVASSRAILSGMKMGMDRCVACHAREAAGRTECSTCHRERRRTTRPSTHDGAWLVRHGERWRAATGARTADRCRLCHTQTSCDDCHQNQRPRSHNESWRGRAHGLLAGMDRSKCMMCHQRDACDACHSRERPRSHSSTFGSPLNRHCYRCHLPLGRGESCRVCHVSTPGHDLAPGLPGDARHQTASTEDCRKCHRPAPHPDNGDRCRFCHR